MINFNEYVRGVLKQILESYQNLLDLNDKPGDLEIIKIELLKINGMLLALSNKMDLSQNQSDDYVRLSKRSKYYLKSYTFEKEINTLTGLYSNDTNRIKNIRLKIIESLQDKKLMQLVESTFHSK